MSTETKTDEAIASIESDVEKLKDEEYKETKINLILTSIGKYASKSSLTKK